MPPVLRTRPPNESFYPKAKVCTSLLPSQHCRGGHVIGRWHVSVGFHIRVRWYIHQWGRWHFPWGWHNSWGVAYPWGVWLWSLLGWWLMEGGIHGGFSLLAKPLEFQYTRERERTMLFGKPSLKSNPTVNTPSFGFVFVRQHHSFAICVQNVHNLHTALRAETQRWPWQ